MKVTSLVIIVLAALLVLALGYIAYGEYIKAVAQKQFSIYEEGYRDGGQAGFQQGEQKGYQQAVLEVMNKAATCQKVPLFVGNQTLNVMAIECFPTIAQQLIVNQS